MTPSVENPFTGRLADGDPRGPLSAAGGCVWPTIPASRYWLISDDATLDLSFLNNEPVLLEFTSPQPAHNLGTWNLLPPDPNVATAVIVKLANALETGYRWFFNIQTIAIPEAPLLFFIARDHETCNRDLALPNTFAFDIDRGVTGDTFRMEQIEWDQLAPPPA